jgi:ABC-type multidrug transport system ATPase subunit
MTLIVEARCLTKRFGTVEALAGLDLAAESGHVTALLGPNGAGKTTFINAVATLLRPDGGELRVAGIDATSKPERVRRIIGLAGQFASVEPTMTGWDNLEFAGLMPVSAALAGAAVTAASLRATTLIGTFVTATGLAVGLGYGHPGRSPAVGSTPGSA